MWEACKGFNITTLVGVKHTEQMNTQAGQNKKQGRVFIYYLLIIIYTHLQMRFQHFTIILTITKFGGDGG